MFICSKCAGQSREEERWRGFQCRTCYTAYQKEWREQNPGYHAAYQRKWITENRWRTTEYEARYLADPNRKERKLQGRRERYQKNRGRELQWAKDNIERLRILKLARHKERYTSEPEYAETCRRHAANTGAKRRGATRNSALPNHFREEIKAIYFACPLGYVVDHIEPLLGKRGGEHVACGLHVPWNLQYLTSEENLRKGCRLEMDQAVSTCNSSPAVEIGLTGV